MTRVFSRVRQGHLHRVASALAFTTLLALVPLITVSFSILSLFPFFSSWRGSVEDFLYSNLVPATGAVDPEAPMTSRISEVVRAEFRFTAEKTGRSATTPVPARRTFYLLN